MLGAYLKAVAEPRAGHTLGFGLVVRYEQGAS
jgi:hypothetical protein